MSKRTDDQEQLADTLQDFNDRADGQPRSIKVPGAPPKKGLCPVRPGSSSGYNPMLFCSFKAGHKGPHSWEIECDQ